MNKSIKKQLFFSFEQLSIKKALWIGTITMLLSGVVNVFTNCHFEGVIHFDMNNGGDYSFQEYIYEGFVAWFVVCLLLYFAGLIFSPSPIRFINLLSMQAFARAPFLLISVSTLLLPHHAVDEYLLILRLKGSYANTINVPLYQWLFFILHTLIIIITSIWIIILMYRAYSFACDLKGVKGIISFIVMMLVAEVIIMGLENIIFD